ncbi:MAG: DUF4395 domain-containing protein [Ferruginibacter sp.]
MANTNLECPVDLVLINGQKARFTAGGIFILALIYLFSYYWPIPAFLIIDFLVRGFNLGRYSLLNFISVKLIQVFEIKSNPTDQAPKRFAAKIGFIFSIAILITLALQLKTWTLILALILATFALLESFFGYCAGCYMYNLYSKTIKKKNTLYSI